MAYAAALFAVLIVTMYRQGRIADSGFAPTGCSTAIEVGDWPRERVYNVILFLPLGFLSALVSRPRVALLGAALAPFLIEGLQAVLPLGRACDLMDVLANLVGVLARNLSSS
jgi:hypothetical protein